MNFLLESRSVYVQKHGRQPVVWRPWGAEALAQARVENKPVLVSVGYGGCAWCERMASESFGDPFIADLMNRHFVCVKVDREEHPALDFLFMEALQLLGEPGAWPLNVFCLPDGRPFFAGTYFPKNDEGQRVAWPQLLMRISNHFSKNFRELEANAHALQEHMQQRNEGFGGAEEALTSNFLVSVAQKLMERMGAPEGPFRVQQPRVLQFLMHLGVIPGCPPLLVAQAQELAEKILQATLTGGLYDAQDGGFFRYLIHSQKPEPFLEKTLYDQGLWLEVCATAYGKTQNPIYAQAIEATVAFSLKMFRGEAGLLNASLGPGLHDPKALLTWQSFWLSGFYAAAEALGRSDWKAQALAFAELLWGTFYDGVSLKPLKYPGAPAEGDALVDDYAFFASALLSLNTTLTCSRAELLLQKAFVDFKDPTGSGYFLTRAEHPFLPLRKKIWTDGRLPSGQSVLLYALAQAQSPQAQELLKNFLGLLKTAPLCSPTALLGAAVCLASGGQERVPGPEK